MPEKEANQESQETKKDAPRFPEHIAQMMSACGPEMLEHMEKCCSGSQTFAGCCGSQPDKETAEKA
jgi:hypothetical protein|tara:strand:- start:92 stop:289 length:198 start_codon:yes stop_codon:yes gene_type:complete